MIKCFLQRNWHNIVLFFFTAGPRVHSHEDEDNQRVEAGRQPAAVHQGQLQPATRVRAEADAQGGGAQEGQGDDDDGGGGREEEEGGGGEGGRAGLAERAQLVEEPAEEAVGGDAHEGGGDQGHGGGGHRSRREKDVSKRIVFMLRWLSQTLCHQNLVARKKFATLWERHFDYLVDVAPLAKKEDL